MSQHPPPLAHAGGKHGIVGQGYTTAGTPIDAGEVRSIPCASVDAVGPAIQFGNLLRGEAPKRRPDVRFGANNIAALLDAGGEQTIFRHTEQPRLVSRHAPVAHSAYHSPLFCRRGHP
jgi:hypothetical protein